MMDKELQQIIEVGKMLGVLEEQDVGYIPEEIGDQLAGIMSVLNHAEEGTEEYEDAEIKFTGLWAKIGREIGMTTDDKFLSLNKEESKITELLVTDKEKAESAGITGNEIRAIEDL